MEAKEVVCDTLACSQAGEEVICHHNTCKDGNVTGMSNGKNTANNCLPKDKKRETSIKPQYSETLTVSSSLVQLNNTKELSMWLRQGSPANHSVLQAQEKRMQMPETNGLQLLAVLRLSNQNTHSSKMSTDSLVQKQQKLKSKMNWYEPMPDLFGTWQLFCETLPPSGMTQGTRLYQRPMSVRPISVSGGGVLQKGERRGGVNWPTPTATDDTERSADNIVLNSNGTPRYKTRKGSLSQARLPESVKAFEGGINIPTPRANDCKKSQNCNPFDPRNGLQGFVNVINNNEMFPTPVSSDGTTGHIIGENDTFKILDSGAIRKINQKGTDGSIGLGRYVRLFPTPQQSDWKGANLSGGKSQSANGLATAVLKFPTPRSSEYKDSGPVGSKSHTHMIKKSYLCTKVKEKSLPSGKLNPDWVCWLMGWPIGWADKEPLPKEAVKDWRKKTLAGLWWQEEPKGIPRVKTYSGEKGIDKPNARNGQVPLTAFFAKQVLFTRWGKS